MTENLSDMKKPTIEQSPVKTRFYRADSPSATGRSPTFGNTYRVSRSCGIICTGMAR
ncbi:conserved hypothetical protein [Agrobacterium salinitolerans str. Hayward 0363]|nr:conserved hypothetical protein [Agrobacterium salinitolerans str. Hayward 0363]